MSESAFVGNLNSFVHYVAPNECFVINVVCSMKVCSNILLLY